MNKKIIVIVVAIVIGIGLLVSLFLIQRKKLANFTVVQTGINTSFKDNAFDSTYKTTNITIKGVTDKSLNFQGDLLSKDVVIQNIIKVGDKTYTKAPKDEKWQIQQNPNFQLPLNMMAHPDYIQLQKRLANSKGNLQYSVIFEQSGQAVLSQMPREELTKIQLNGTVILDKSNFQLKELKLHQGTETKNEVVIDYTVNPNPPVIVEPKV